MSSPRNGQDARFTNAGTGSNLTRSGRVECDASVVDCSGAFGAVSGLAGVCRACVCAAHWCTAGCLVPPRSSTARSLFNRPLARQPPARSSTVPQPVAGSSSAHPLLYRPLKAFPAPLPSIALSRQQPGARGAPPLHDRAAPAGRHDHPTHVSCLALGGGRSELGDGSCVDKSPPRPLLPQLSCGPWG